MFFRCIPFPSTEDIILSINIEAKSIEFEGPCPQGRDEVDLTCTFLLISGTSKCVIKSTGGRLRPCGLRHL